MPLARGVMSEACLAEGFIFQPKKPCIPGQFFKVPQQQAVNFHQGQLGSLIDSDDRLANNTKFPRHKDQANQPASSSLDLHEFASSSHHATPMKSALQASTLDGSPRKSREISQNSNLQRPLLIKSSTSSTEKQTSPSLSQTQSQTRSSSSCGHDEITTALPEQSLNVRHKSQASKSSRTASKDKNATRDSQEPPHLWKPSGHQTKATSSSTCGDLEGPVAQSPARSQKGLRKPRSRRTPRILPSLEDQRMPIHCREHSFSQAEKHKQDLMQQFASTWNDILQQLEQEKFSLTQQYESQQRHVRRLEQNLQRAQEARQEDQKRREALEESIKAFEGQKEAMTQDNERINLELLTMRKSLADSEQKTVKISEKSKLIKNKLNEAIEEQQNLYKQSTDRCQSLANELEVERLRQADNSQKIEEALRNSRRKREALIKGYRESQAEKDAEVIRKDSIIANLEQVLKEKQESLCIEKQTADQLRCQIDTMHNETGHSMKELTSKMTEVYNLIQQTQRGQEANDFLAGFMAQKMSNIADRLTQVVASATSSVDTHSVASVLEAKFTSLEASITQATSQQDIFAHRLAEARTCFAKEFSNVKGTLDMLVEKHQEGHQAAREAKLQVSNTLEKLETDVEETRKVCDGMMAYLDSNSVSILKKLETVNELHAEGIRKQIKDLDISLHEKETQTQLTQEHHTARVNDLSTQLAENLKDTEMFMRNEFSKFSNNLSECINTLDSVAKEKLHESEKAARDLKIQLEGAQVELTEAQQHVCPDVDGLRKRLEKEKSRAAQLTNDIRNLQTQQAITQKGKLEWPQDIEAVYSLQSHVKCMVQKFSILDTLQSKLSDFFNLKSNVDSSAQFLENEEKWIKWKLNGAKHDCRAERASPQQRRVTIQSPSHIARTPSPRLSVHQEQARRRSGQLVQSILKSSQSSQETQSFEQVPREDGTDDLKSSQTLNRAQHGQSMATKTSGAPLSGGNSNHIIENIRSVLVPRILSQQNALLTVADYERSQNSALKHQTDEVTVDPRHAKRPKLEP